MRRFAIAVWQAESRRGAAAAVSMWVAEDIEACMRWFNSLGRE